MAKASISSMKITAGAAIRAFLNISLTIFSDSPTHLENISGPLTAMKLAPDSVATALARRVFPVPGGPNSRMPLGGRRPNFLNLSGYLRGHSTASRSSCLTFSRPPTSSQRTRGTSMWISLNADGIISLSAFMKSAIVTFIFSNASGGIDDWFKSINPL